MNKFTVFMIVHNEEKRLTELIPYLKSFNLDIVVVNQGSTDRTAQILDEYNVEYINTEKAGYSERDRIYINSCLVKTDYILYLDADEIPSETLIDVLMTKNLTLDSYSIKFIMDDPLLSNHRLHRFFNKMCVEVKPWLHSKFIPIKHCKYGPLLERECFIDARHKDDEIQIGVNELNSIAQKAECVNPYWLNAHMPKQVDAVATNQTFDESLAIKCSKLFGMYSSVLYYGDNFYNFKYRDVFENECLYCHGFFPNEDAPYISKTCAYAKNPNSIVTRYDWAFLESVKSLDGLAKKISCGIVSNVMFEYCPSHGFSRSKFFEKILDTPGVFVYTR